MQQSDQNGEADERDRPPANRRKTNGGQQAEGRSGNFGEAIHRVAIAARWGNAKSMVVHCRHARHRQGMLSLAIPALFAAAAPVPLDSLLVERVRCVAVLAIIANDQQRGATIWPGFPPLARRGAHFAKLVGEGVMAQTGRSKEQVRDAILAEVKTLQKTPGNGAVTANGQSCVALMNQVAPPPPPPDRAWCAALASDTYDSVSRAEGHSPRAQNLGNIAALLDAAARDDLRAKGKSGNQADQVISEARARMARDATALKLAGKSRVLDLEPCLELLQAR
ncbi:MAG: hypothetical protein RL367_36 [Pseudomonadota bacterium]